MSNTKSAFVTIPIVSSFLIVGIVVCLQWAPFHKRTLKKPGTNKHLFTLKLSIMMMMLILGPLSVLGTDVGDKLWMSPF